MKKEKYQKILIGITLIAILLGLKAPQIKADTVNYTYKQYRVQYYSLGQGTTAWNSWTNFGTSSPFSDGYGVSSLAVRFGQSNDFTTGNTYRIVIDSGFSPQSEKQYISYSGSSCYGSSSTSSWNNVEIPDCQYVGMADTPNSVHRKFVFDVTPSVNYKGIQININFSGTAEIRGVNVYNTSTITTGPDITSAIDEQTLIIEDGFTDITNIINQTNEDLINAITEQNQVCDIIDKNKINQQNKAINSSGNIVDSNGWGITDYIKIDKNTKLTVKDTISTGSYICFYNINKTTLSCTLQNSYSLGQLITIPNNASYFISTINLNQNKPQYQICRNGNQALIDTDHNYSGTQEIEEGTSLVDDMNELEDSILEYFGYEDIDFTIPYDQYTVQWIWTKINDIYENTFFSALFNGIIILILMKLVLGRS